MPAPNLPRSAASVRSAASRGGARSVGVALCLLATSGCSLVPKPLPDPTRYYVLSSSGAVTAAPAAGVPTLSLRPVELASYLRARPMLVRRGSNEIEFRDLARWGEALEQGVARVLREELLARGVPATGAARLVDPTPGATLAVRVLACEGGADGSVVFRAAWEVVRAGEKGGTLRGEYRATDLFWGGKDEALLAARLSEAVAGLAGEIAAALKK